VSLILLFNVMLGSISGNLNIYTGVVFLVFGLGMMFIRKSDKA
jgi:hypothetical protein